GADTATYTRAYERVVALLEKRSVNQATIVKFQQLWNKNILLNQPVIQHSATLEDLLALPPPTAIVLAGAGPSLEHSMAALRFFRDRFILFAADTALVPLNRAGIFPDFVFSSDPQWVNHHFAETPHAARSRWLLDPVVCHALAHRLKAVGARTAFWNNVFITDACLRERERGDVAHGGSVSTNAFDVALRWLLRAEEGIRFLILVGQDLSFSNRQAHCRGAVLEAAVFTRLDRLHTMEQHNLRQMRAMPTLWLKGIRCEKVPTNGKLRIFHEWFESRAAETDKSRVRLINATHDGAWLRGFEHIPLEEILPQLPIAQTLPDWPQPVSNSTWRGKIIKLCRNLENVRRLAEENATLSAYQKPSPDILRQLDANDAKLRQAGTAHEIAGLNAQSLILKITEEGNEPNAVEFYRTLAKSARVVRHWAQKLV
ncbi:MAG: DUF115 domain-containing protein, partial [Turneriella sp.]|nr:DUF115 domain-containing protein [Turneriella sp.]